MTFLIVPTPPRLPDPEADFSPRANAAMLQVLRLYFAQLDAVLRALLGRDGGQFIEFPTASFFAGAQQALPDSLDAAVDVPLLTSAQRLVKLSGASIVAEVAGTYSIAVELSVRNDDGVEHNISVWLRKNGVGLPTSRNDAFLPPDATTPVNVSYVVDLLPTDTFEIMVFVDGPNISLFAPVAFGPVPRGAAARINVVLVSSDSSALLTVGRTIEKTVIDPPP